MAQVRMTAARAKSAGRVDQAKLNATTEADMERHAIEDDALLADDEWYPAPATVRANLGLSQPAMAALLRIPVGTWRNWEQNRVQLDPAVQTLLRVLMREPDAVKRAMEAA